MIKGWIAALGLMMAANGAAAQIDTSGMEGVIEACYLGSEPHDGMPECVGQAASMCQEVNSYATPDVVDCMAFETARWDWYLNRVYQAQRDELERRDTDQGGRIMRAEALLEAQRAWIAFRDAECSLRYAMYQDGTIRSIIQSDCVMRHTARRVFELRTISQG